MDKWDTENSFSEREIKASDGLEINIASYELRLPVLSDLGDELVLLLGLGAFVASCSVKMANPPP